LLGDGGEYSSLASWSVTVMEQVNWTATYRLDSTLVAPYERFTYFTNYSGRLPDTAPLRDVKAGKTRHVAWFVSNCDARNGRSAYAQELQNYIGRSVTHSL